MSEVSKTDTVPGEAKRKKRRWPKVVLAAVVVLVAAAGGLYLYLDSLAGEGESGELSGSYATVKDLRGDVMNFLVCGLDYEDERDYGDRSKSFTDLVMYVTVDIKGGKISILQIPRDTWVGDEVATGGTGKLNAVFRNSTGARIEALAALLHDQMSLTVDHYITVDMQAFKAMMDIFDASQGGIEMTVPWDIVDQSTGETLPAGTYKINGATAEFILRNRNFATGDLQRLETQRYFYLALYKALISLPVTDMAKMLPVYSYYVETDMSMASLGSLCLRVMNTDKSNIFLCKAPVGGAADGTSNVILNREALAELLNRNFRPYTEPVPAEMLKTAQGDVVGNYYAIDDGQYFSDLMGQ